MAVKGKVLGLVVLLVALLLGAGVSLEVYLALRDPPRRTIVFPDGSMLTVLGASLGNQPFTIDKVWQRKLRRWLPAKLQGWLSVPFASLPKGRLPATNSLAVWFTYVDPRGSNLITTSYARWAWMLAVPMADDGFRFGRSEARDSSSYAAGNVRVGQLWLGSFPRRQSNFELQFFDRDTHLLGSVSVPNPVKGPFPEWRPEPLPIVRTNGPLAITLLSVTETEQGSSRFTGRGGADQIRLTTSARMGVAWTYRLASADPAWRQAAIVDSLVQWSDATGNEGPLDYKEPAWKLALMFRSQISTNYAESERFVLSGFKPPEPGTVQELTNEFVRLGVRFRLRCLAGAGILAVTNNGGLSMLSALPEASHTISRVGSLPDTPGLVTTVSSGRPLFLFEYSQGDRLSDFHCRILGSNGRVLSGEFIIPGLSSPVPKLWWFSFDAANEAGPVSLEAAVSPPLTFELLVNPAEVQRIGAGGM